MKNLKTFEDYSMPHQIMNIIDLSKMSARTELDEGSILKILQNSFRNKGDGGVIEMFKDITGLNIEPITHGKYIFKYNDN